MTHPVWYLLYGGSSEDGRGPGKYIGRTTESDVAFKHARECASDPYSTGYVIALTDRCDIRMPGRLADRPAWDRYVTSIS